ncbi:PQQ-dependent sugar dehydrogenase [Lacinutrix neustonica]|uniref:PQQ-dependent sugar dehydrogenase n=1 Tax=Lacinutrix neustonica TaxID=2980107 RepID=A0A9E8MWU4_9FLAO|nr:PQQ-dependent sugar dehydrogenase [Lacinutrix neustonica]WAC02037.1 PQQ-dependent sugar dehydrogenase [Lacinutrix neustonica]
MHVTRLAQIRDIANTTETVLLTISQPFANHNGGKIAFGPDGYIYIATGDGGSAGDPGNRAQSPNTLLGKILRIDVSGATYTIPGDNPYASYGGLPEIYAIGLRNPWKFSFDKMTGDLWIADVGQNAYEEINSVNSSELQEVITVGDAMRVTIILTIQAQEAVLYLAIR